MVQKKLDLHAICAMLNIVRNELDEGKAMNVIRIVIVAVVIVLTSGNFAMAKTSISNEALAAAMDYVTSLESITTMSKYLAKKVKRGDVTFDAMRAPSITFISQQELNERFLKDEVNETLRNGIKNLRAAYDNNTNGIYLLDTWNESNVFDMETLVHEMAHHVQYYASVDKMKTCSAILEDAAYRIGKRYLIDNGVTDEKILKQRKLLAFMFGRCSHDR